MVYKKLVEFAGSISKMGEARVINIPRCIIDNVEDYHGKKLKVTVSVLE